MNREGECESLPAPTRATRELPDEAAVEAAGIKLPVDEARLVLAVLSAVIGRGHSKTRDKIHQMVTGLVAAATIDIERDGVIEPAPHPELTLTGWPAGPSAFRRLGI